MGVLPLIELVIAYLTILSHKLILNIWNVSCKSDFMLKWPALAQQPCVF